MRSSVQKPGKQLKSERSEDRISTCSGLVPTPILGLLSKAPLAFMRDQSWAANGSGYTSTWTPALEPDLPGSRPDVGESPNESSRAILKIFKSLFPYHTK